MFTNAHPAGVKTCVYCGEIFRRYHNVASFANASDFEKESWPEEKEEEGEEPKLSGSKIAGIDPRLEVYDDDTVSCTNVNCARAGWCMCN